MTSSQGHPDSWRSPATLPRTPDRPYPLSVTVTPSILALLRDLVAVPSRGGVDDYAPVIAVVESWLRSVGIAARPLTAPDGRTVALKAALGPGGSELLLVGVATLAHLFGRRRPR